MDGVESKYTTRQKTAFLLFFCLENKSANYAIFCVFNRFSFIYLIFFRESLLPLPKRDIFLPNASAQTPFYISLTFES